MVVGFDLENLLSGLKQKPTTTPPPVPPVQSNASYAPTFGSESVVSVSSLKDLDGTPLPKKSKRRQNTSNRNTVSLDI